MKDFIIYRDTREQNPWKFIARKPCLGMEDKKLDTGDYTISGFEDRVVIERKASSAELANNLTHDWKRFQKELKRLIHFDHSLIVCEFTLEDLLDYPKHSGIPPALWKKIRIRGNYLLRKILEIELEYGVRCIWAGNRAREFSLSFFKRIADAK
jgi:ERCC4-type nuclease